MSEQEFGFLDKNLVLNDLDNSDDIGLLEMSSHGTQAQNVKKNAKEKCDNLKSKEKKDELVKNDHTVIHMSYNEQDKGFGSETQNQKSNS